MDKAKAVAILFVGVFLIYLGAFGSQGFAFFGRLLTLTSGFSDYFTSSTIDSARWMVLPGAGGLGGVSQGSGKVTITGSGPVIGGGYATISDYQLSSADISIDVVTNSPNGEAGLLISSDPISGNPKSTTGHWYAVIVYTSGFTKTLYVEECNGVTYFPPLLQTSVTSATGQLKISIASGTVKFYFAGVQVFSEAWSLPSTACYIDFYGLDPVVGSMTIQFSNFVLSTGAVPPTYSDVTIAAAGQSIGTTSPAVGHYPSTYLVGGSLTITVISGTFDYMTRNGQVVSSMTLSPLTATELIVVYFKQGGPTTGTLRVFASYNGAYVAASVTASGPQTVSGSTTTDPNNPLSFTVAAGTYSVSGTYSYGSATPVSVTVPAGGSADAPLSFGGSTPGPDFLAMILAFFDSTAVRTLSIMVGVGMTGLSVILLFSGKKRPSYSPAPFY